MSKKKPDPPDEGKKTVPIRLPRPLLVAANLAARAFGKSTPQYIALAVRAALERDLPRIGAIAQKQLENLPAENEDEDE